MNKYQAQKIESYVKENEAQLLEDLKTLPLSEVVIKVIEKSKTQPIKFPDITDFVKDDNSRLVESLITRSIGGIAIFRGNKYPENFLKKHFGLKKAEFDKNKLISGHYIEIKEEKEDKKENNGNGGNGNKQNNGNGNKNNGNKGNGNKQNKSK